MTNLYFKIVNPIVKTILRSPLHGLMSHNTILLKFTGRTSGKTFFTPISYHLADNTVHCFTSLQSKWWRNLSEEREVTITLKGKTFTVTPKLNHEDTGAVQSALYEFLLAVPRDAPHSGVSLGEAQKPSIIDIKKVAPGLVHIQLPLT